jgi:cytochrome c biogenesis protein CcmG, thiol:disulfide interchange protein DsbE
MRVKRPPALAAGVFSFLMLACGLVHAEAEIRPWKGGATPALKLRDLQDKSVDLAAMKGRVVLVNFWATWCEPCRDEMPALERLRAKLKGRSFELVTVNFGESDATVTRFLAKLNVSLPVLLDPVKEAADAWKVRGLPMTFLIDAGGATRYWSFGEQDWSQGEPFRVVESLVNEAARAQR